jgi:hypothetical protein
MARKRCWRRRRKNQSQSEEGTEDWYQSETERREHGFPGWAKSLSESKLEEMVRFCAELRGGYEIALAESRNRIVRDPCS